MQSIRNSPDIESLYVKIRYNLDLPVPSVSALNLSTGSGLSNCKWVFELIDPYGVSFHSATFEAPDRNGLWTEYSIPGRLTQVAGHLIWGGEYKAIIKVQDSEGQVFQDVVKRVIRRPQGNTDAMGSNFGKADVSATVQCATAQLLIEDKSNYSYCGIQGGVVSNVLKLIYPADATNVQPVPFYAEDIAHGLLPLYFNGEGHQVVLDTVRDYDDDNTIVRLKYKFSKSFSVRCGADLCDLNCIIQLYLKRLSSGHCGAEESSQMVRIIGLAQQAIIGIIQPLCGVDVAKIMCDVRAIVGNDCGCTEKADGLNRALAYSNCPAPTGLSVQWNAEEEVIVVNWDSMPGAIDKLTIPELGFKRNKIVPPIGIPSGPNVLMTIKVNRLCADGSLSYRDLTFQSQVGQSDLPLLITKHPLTQVVNFGGNVTLLVQAKGHEPLSYQWYKNGVIIAGETNQVLALSSVDYSTAGSYTAVVTDADGTTATSNPGVLTVQKPLVIIQHPQSVAGTVGGAANFEVSADGDLPLRYQWFKGATPLAGQTASTLFLSNTQLADQGQYRVQVWDATDETVFSNYAGLLINQPVIIVLHPASQGLNLGQTISLNVVATGDNPLTYQWMKNGTDIPGAIGSSYAIVNAKATDAAGYSVRVTDADGDTATSNIAIVSVNQLVIITQHPQSQAKLYGENATFSVAATGDNPLTYQWRRDGVNIPGANSDTLTISNLAAGDIGAYTAYVQDANGDSAISNAAALSLNRLVLITEHPATQAVQTGNAVTFNVEATGDNPLSYQWYKNGTAITGAVAKQYVISAVTAGSAGSYTVRVTDANGDNATSNIAVLTVTTAPGTSYQMYWSARTSISAYDIETSIPVPGMDYSAVMSAGSLPVADWRNEDPGVPKHLFMAEPSTNPIRTYWFANVNSEGDIGAPGDILDELTFAWKIVGGWRLYYSTYRTEQHTNTVTFHTTRPST